MKKLFLILVAVMFVLVAFAACNQATSHDYPDDGRFDIVSGATIPTENLENIHDNDDTNAVEPIVYAPAPPIETLLYSFVYDEHIQGLELGATGSQQVMNGLPLGVSGSPTYTVVANPNELRFVAGGNSIEVSNRNANFDAIDINFAALDFSYGAVYVFRASGRAAAGITMQFGRTDAPWSSFTTAVVSDDGEWSLEHTLATTDLMEYFVSNQRGVRIMTNDAPTENFIVDHIEVIRIGERGYDEPIVPEWDLTAQSLSEAFAEYFLLGNIWSNQSRMTSFNTNEGFLHHFNAVTAENNHKVDTIARTSDNWTFDTADAIVDWAEENDLAMIGHTLVWHSQSPPWLTTAADCTQPLTRAEAIENMHLYIRTVAARYAGRIYAWDVVNEAISGAGASEWRNNPDWRAFMRQAGRGLDEERQSQWYNAFANGAEGDECGSDYIFYAFRFARIYDPFAILYYNDYNDHVPGKRDAITQMVIQVNERWQNDPLYDGRLLIEGIGMQAHYSITGWMTNPQYVRSAIELYITTGARL
ncbi:MAG: endo-1,4-beta-xylanase, partial [Defluviitaleaceae bacterium]|nr:endo-1,4-beta-xylanase [Defluviitaleaceae bacterium]